MPALGATGGPVRDCGTITGGPGGELAYSVLGLEIFSGSQRD